jgi:hypothetical protein
LPVTQYDEDISEEGGSGAASYVSDRDQYCCGCGHVALDATIQIRKLVKRIATFHIVYNAMGK